MRSHLHADHAGPWPTHRATKSEPTELGPLKVRPPWLVFLAKHFARRNHERWQLQGSDLPREVWDQAFPPLTAEEKAQLEAIGVRFGRDEPFAFAPARKRPWWLAFLYRIRVLRDDDDGDE